MLENELIKNQLKEIDERIAINWKAIKNILAYRFGKKGEEKERRQREIFTGWETRWISTVEKAAAENGRLRERREEIKMNFGVKSVRRQKSASICHQISTRRDDRTYGNGVG